MKVHLLAFIYMWAKIPDNRFMLTQILSAFIQHEIVDFKFDN